jgi:hypothetical protein
MNYKLQQLADEAFITAIVKDDLLHKYADGGLMQSVGAGIKEEVMKMWDPQHPIESIAGIAMPGIIWGISPWTAIIYEVADAMGFDWKSFWGSVGEALKDFLKGLISIPTEQDISEKMNSIVSSAATNSFNGEVNQEKLDQLIQKKSDTLDDIETLKKFAINVEHNPKLYKASQGFLLRPLKSRIARFFIRVIAWAFKTALVGIGLTAARGALSTALHLATGGGAEMPSGEQSPSGNVGKTDYTPQTTPNLPANLSENLLQVHRNDLSRVWVENYNIGQVENLLSSWVTEAYPNIDKTKLQASNALQSVVNEFRNRNRLGEGTGLVVVPEGYVRKIDVAAKIANNFIKENPDAVQKEQIPPETKQQTDL